MDFIFRKLRTILYEKFSFHYDQIQPETHLELELGMDSREMFELLEELEKML
jgi:acyl carrier protein